MKLEEFLAEAERLQRKSTVLRFEGPGEPIGFWHGEIDGGPWISVRDQNRWLTVYIEDSSSSGYTVRTEEPVVSTRVLYGDEAISLPPVDAVFLLGSTKVESYLHRHGWEREWAFNNNFQDSVPFEYQKIHKSNCPIFLDGAVAVLGGWNIPWPDGDFEQLINARLIVWTIEGAEPWVEVFDDGGVFIVKQRIT